MSKTLMGVNGDDWKRIRSIVTPTFTSSKIKRMYPLMKQAFEDFAAHLKPLADKKSDIELKTEFSHFALDVISTSAFATKFDVHNGEDNPFVRNAIQSFNISDIRNFVQTFFPISLLKFLFMTGLFKINSIDFFITHLRNIFETRRKSDKKFNDFMQLLIEAERDDQNMRDEEDINDSHHVNEGMN